MLVRDSDVTGMYDSVEQLATDLKSMSKAVITSPDYSGVTINFLNGKFVVYDSTVSSAVQGGSSASNPKQILFTELIGQPTWIEPGTLQINCPLRSDVGVGDFIKLPPTPVTTLAASQPQARDKSAFQGVFQVGVPLRHVGDSRQPDAAAWVTTINAYQADNPADTQ
jgi:hypothetical protein